MTATLDNIPLQLRVYKSWVLWRAEEAQNGKLTKIPYCAKTARLAKVNEPETWDTFDFCKNTLEKYPEFYSGIGFVLSEKDPFTFIDLDDCEGDEEAIKKQVFIFNQFESYAEISPSGKGLHIIVKGDLPTGRRRGKIELYSKDRFMTMTGNVYRNSEIKDYDAQLKMLHASMTSNEAETAAMYAGLTLPQQTDEQILEIASNAANGEKFSILWAGQWQHYYASQSEADFALVDILAYYSKNKGQIKRMFLASGLGQRDKAKRNDYINYMLNRCFDKMLPPIDIEGLRIQLEEAIAAKEKDIEPEEQKPLQVAELIPNAAAIPLPPGLVGEIAQFIYSSAHRPVAEIALCGAIAFVSAIVGRSYNISGTGLNQYLLLVAKSSRGKDAMKSGIDKLIGEVKKIVPMAQQFTAPNFASAEALTKHFTESPSFLSYLPEFGILLSELTDPKAMPARKVFLQMYLDLFSRSGNGEVLYGRAYSSKENNTALVQSPALTLLGDTQPEILYPTLNDRMIASGFLPRFTIIEYHGPRVPPNKAASEVTPSFELIDKTARLMNNALTLNQQNKAINVELEPLALKMMDSFNDYCDNQINADDGNVRSNIWGRAHLKALKMAGVIAVGCNPYLPKVTEAIAKWSIDIIIGDCKNMVMRFNAGEIGTDNEETKQIAAVMKTCMDWITKDFESVKMYAKQVPETLHVDKVIPFSFIQPKLISLATFRKDRIGATNALKRAVQTLIERGDLVEVPKPTMVKQYGTQARAFMLTNA